LFQVHNCKYLTRRW